MKTEVLSVGQVEHYDLKRLLLHDEHLHGGFNDCFGAPKFGGTARR